MIMVKIMIRNFLHAAHLGSPIGVKVLRSLRTNLSLIAMHETLGKMTLIQSSLLVYVNVSVVGY